MRLAWIACALASASCVKSESVACGDRTCPESTVCDAVHALCVTQPQIDSCAGKTDGDTCAEAGRAGAGLCDAGVCIPGCGDTVDDAGEECDDGNAIDNDGCSTTCALETPRWTQWQPVWQGLARHIGVYDSARGKLIAVTGKNEIALFPDQWERDSLRRWTHSRPGHPLRYYASAAFDDKRDRVVLFGGYDTAERNDVWEYDGAAWTQVNVSGTPPAARYGASMVWDSTREKIVLFGGRTSANTFYADTWEYDGTTWTALTTTGALAARAYAAMAYDPIRDRIVVNGGQYSGGTANDTWELSGTAWAKTSPDPGDTLPRPQARFGHSMAYSPERSKVVLFGGYVSCSVLGVPQRCASADTWEYGATGWTNIIRASSPSSRADASLTWDPSVNALVLVGGIGELGTITTDAWEYSTSGWGRYQPRVTPTEREGAAMTANAAGDQLLLFGGFDRELGHQKDTWRFRGGEWVEDLPANPPTARTLAGLAFDTRAQQFLLFSGAGPSGRPRDASQWTGTDWVALPTPGPTGRSESVLVDDVAGNRLVLYGGRDSTKVLDETWEYANGAWQQQTGATQPGAHASAASAYDANRERVVLVDPSGATWTYEGGSWSALTVETAAPARNAAVMAYVPWRGTVVRYGGTDSEARGDLWELVHDDTRGTDTWRQVELLGAQPPIAPRAGLAALASERMLVLFGGSQQDETWLLQWR